MSDKLECALSLQLSEELRFSITNGCLVSSILGISYESEFAENESQSELKSLSRFVINLLNFLFFGRSSYYLESNSCSTVFFPDKLNFFRISPLPLTLIF